MACFGFVTFLPLRPLLSVPAFISSISRFTCLPAPRPYLVGDFFEPLFFAANFFAGAFFAAVFFADLFAAFLVAIWVSPPLKFEGAWGFDVVSVLAAVERKDCGDCDHEAKYGRDDCDGASTAVGFEFAALPCGVGGVEIGGETGDGYIGKVGCWE
jgi:hypothetical protein